jgi:Cu2+-exporting ATPase
LVSANQQSTAQESPTTFNNIKEVVGAGISATFQANTAYTDLINSHLKLGSAKFCGIAEPSELSQQVFLADANGWLATFSLHEAVKHNAALAIQQLKDANLSVELLSGDQAHTVVNTANEIGITQFQAACSPQDKLSRLHALKQQGKNILMVGDGLNDGPILASAHVSIAMGKGVPLTLAHADYVLLNGDISQIPQLIRHARKTMTIIKQNIAWAIVYNVVCIPLAFFGVLSAWLAGLGMAVSSIIVVLNALRLTTFSETKAK